MIYHKSRSAQRIQTMKRTLSRVSISLLALLLSPAALAATLQAVDVASLPGDRVELKLSFDQPVPAPTGYTIEQPARIALDLPGVTNGLQARSREIGGGNARSLSVAEAMGRTRMIVNLASLVPYTTRADGRNVYVVLGERSSAVPAATAAGSRPLGNTPSRALPQTASSRSLGTSQPYLAGGGQAIRNIDFERGPQGEGNVVIDLSSAGVNPDIQEVGGKIRLDFSKTQLPDQLRVRLDVKDFATPVQYVSASGAGDKASITIEPHGLFDYLAYQTDNRLILSVKPLTQSDAEQRNKDRFIYTGEKLSLNFQDIDVRSVLQLIADFTDLNLVASDTVQGNITLRLQNVPWDQALDLVLKTKGLDKRKIGNVLLVAPAAEITERERQELEARQQLQALAPLRREIIQLNYAKATDIAKLFKEYAEGGEEKGGKKQSEWRGSIIADDRTNSLMANLTDDRMEELRRIVTQLDVPVRQVMIEARIVEASVGYDKALGVRWGAASTAKGGKWRFYGKDGATIVDDEGQLYFPGTDTAGNYKADDGTMSVPQVDLGVVDSTSGIGIGFLTDNLMLDLQLTAMESSGNGEVVSQPKVVTADKETAKILKGTSVPYQESSSSGATSVTWKEAALSLEVTPQITPDNRVILDVKVNKDTPDYANDTGSGPPIDTNSVAAKVLVADGETLVIGGVFSNSQGKTVEKVPFLGDLPYLGRLFRRDSVTESKSELLIFLTPRIMDTRAVHAVGR